MKRVDWVVFSRILVLNIIFAGIPAIASAQEMGRAPDQSGKPTVRCTELVSGKLFVHSGTIPQFFKIQLRPSPEMTVGPVRDFSVSNQDDQPVPNVAATLTATIERVMPFYEAQVSLPQPRGNPSPVTEIRKVYAVTVTLKSTDYDLDWKFGGDYQYPVKEMTRDVFCTIQNAQ